jgi:hypothetical protein
LVEAADFRQRRFNIAASAHQAGNKLVGLSFGRRLDLCAVVLDVDIAKPGTGEQRESRRRCKCA